MAIKEYKIDYDFKAEIIVEIDHDIANEASLHEINNFWSDSQFRLSSENSVLDAVLKMLAQQILIIQTYHGYTLDGVLSLFDWNRNGGQEGWPSLDGSPGIKLTSVDTFEFDESDMSISEING